MKTIVVTGTSRGIGQAIAKELLTQGHLVFGISRSLPSNELFTFKNYHYIQLDMTSSTAPKQVYDKVMAITDTIDSFVHNAGVLQIQRIENIHLNEMKSLMDVNLYSSISFIQQFLPKLRKSKGSIVLVSSGAAVNAYSAWGAYCISKASINMLASVLAVEEPLITSVAIRPGVVDTLMQNQIRETGVEMKDQDHEKFVGLKNENKLLDPDVPGYKIASFAANPKFALNGKFLDWSEL
jgi:NAD(P)-dependent dehydrogenase (short-subunit alcohol dehydrogenase family)